MSDNSQDTQLSAEYAMALDLSSQLTILLDEPAVLDRILDIFCVLFAPKRTVFWVMDHGVVVTTLTSPKSASPLLFPGNDRDFPELTPAGFLLRIPYKDETLGIIEVDGIAFPAHRERYLSLALAITGVCGLAIANARAHTNLEAALATLRQEYDRSAQLSQELRVLNESLEERVRERTRELEDTARHLEEEVKQRKTAECVVQQHLNEKTVLLRELHHRVKNNLQLISSMLSIQSRKVKDPAFQLVLSETKNRIRTMSAIHEKLWAANDLSHIDLDGLIRQIPANLLSLYHIPGGKVTINMNIPKTGVDINPAIPLGLILNELFANSLKHAFPHDRTGAIILDIQEESGQVVIRFSDNGVGLPAGYDWENADSTGLMIVTSLVSQLQGTITREPVAGTSFLIRLPRLHGGEGAVRGTFNEIPGR